MKGVSPMAEAMVSEITCFSTHDGPGVRTSVFIKGCPLRCRWCSNPETWTKERNLYHHAARCTGCGRCLTKCPQGAISLKDGISDIDRRACTLCFECVNACLQKVFSISGKTMSSEQAFELVKRDKPFFGDEGGLTLSGGEPLSSPEFTYELFSLCKQEGISTVLDTTGLGKKEDLEKILTVTDLVLLDIKHMDSEQHRLWTGVPNEAILEHADLIMRSVPTRVSFPLVPGANDGKENVEALVDFVAKRKVEWVDINPLHSLGETKYRNLGLTSPYDELRSPTSEEVKAVRDAFARVGVNTTVGRMM